jgi:hypothetical protein
MDQRVTSRRAIALVAQIARGRAKLAQLKFDEEVLVAGNAM